MFFDNLTPDELVKVENIGVHKLYSKDDIIIEEGKAGTSFFLILDGKVEVLKGLPEGGRRRLIELGPCDLVGEVGFLGVEARTARVVALTDCEVLEFKRDLFETLITAHPIIGLKAYRGMAHELAQRLAQVDQNLMDHIGWALGQAKNREKGKAGAT